MAIHMNGRPSDTLSRSIRWYSVAILAGVGLTLMLSILFGVKEMRSRPTDLRDPQNLFTDLSTIKKEISCPTTVEVYTSPGFFPVEAAKFAEYALLPCNIDWKNDELSKRRTEYVIVHETHSEFPSLHEVRLRTAHFALLRRSP